jgi:hypothetical protein
VGEGGVGVADGNGCVGLGVYVAGSGIASETLSGVAAPRQADKIKKSETITNVVHVFIKVESPNFLTTVQPLGSNAPASGSIISDTACPVCIPTLERGNEEAERLHFL